MKVLHIAECFSGGVYDFIKDFVNETPDYSHTILYGKRENIKENFKEEFNKNINFIYWKNAKREISLKNDFLALKEVVNLLKKENYDIIHLHSSKAGFLGRVAGRICNQQNKIIYTTHGISFLRKDISDLKLKLYILFEKVGKFCGGKVIACSKSEAEFIKSKGIDCEYINNGVKVTGNFIKLLKNDSTIKIITVGRITTQKNPELFNKIAENFIENKKIKFIWAGDGEKREVLNSPNIEITGWLNQNEVKKKLQEIDIYLSTSSWEGLSLAVLQAMEYKLPLILSNCVGNIDLVNENYNGYIFKNSDDAVKGIERLLQNKELIEEFGKNSEELLKKKFDIHKMIGKYKNYYIHGKRNMVKKIKIVEFVSRLEFGGAETMLLNYISHFKNKEKFDLQIITQDVNDSNCIKEFKDNGYTVHIVTHKRKSIIKNLKEIYRIMKAENFDIAHSHMTLTNFYVLFLAKILGVNIRISHAHSALNDYGIKSKILYPILKFLNKKIANIWMACGYEAGKFLYGEKAVKFGKVYIIHNAIDLKKFQKEKVIRDSIRKKYGITNDLCIGHIGRFMKVKNHMFIIHIFSKIIQIYSNSKLLLVGDGELREQIHQEVKKLKLEKNVIFTGNVLNTNELYQAMDVFILPSFFEGLPMVSIEAQAIGLPCIISDKVDKNCKITENVQFMSIEKSPYEWALAIINASKKKSIISYNFELTKAGYNIEVEAQKLEEFYIKRE